MASSEPPPPIVTRAAVKMIAESVGIAQATSPGRDTPWARVWPRAVGEEDGK